MSNKSRINCFKLFLSMFYLSSFTLGGGYVIVPLMKKKFIEDLDWIDDEEMMNIIAIAQTSPGAIAINTSILLGYRLGGVLGALSSIAGSVLPPLIIMSVLSIFYTYVLSYPQITKIFVAMQTGVAAVIISTVITMGKAACKNNRLIGIAFITAVFSASYFFKINIMLILGSVILTAIALSCLQLKSQKKKER